MRCFTANEEVHVGIHPEIREGKTGIHFVDQSGEGVVLPMNRDWLDRVYALDQKVLDQKLLQEGCSLGLPLIVSAEISLDGTELVGRALDHRKTQAMVLIEPPFNDSRAEYTAVSFREIAKPDGGVARQYGPIEEAVGVEVLIHQGPRMLIVMNSEAMFRIQFTTEDGSTRSLLYQWRDKSRQPELVLVNSQRKARSKMFEVLEQLTGAV